MGATMAISTAAAAICRAWRILRAWAKRKAGGNGTSGQFIALAERISGQQLDALFDARCSRPASRRSA